METKVFIESLRQIGVEISKEEEKMLQESLQKRFSYVPRIGVFGKTGVGKSTLCNALFGKDVCSVSDVGSCTREQQEVKLEKVILVDCPGIAESQERDEEYLEMYYNTISELDAVFWVLKADDKAYAPDLNFYLSIKEKIREDAPVIFVINQIDKVNPIREWDVYKHVPGAKQLATIQNLVRHIASTFGVVESKVVPVSAEEKYNLVTLMVEMFDKLPSEKVAILIDSLDEELQEDEEIENQRQKSLVESLLSAAKEVLKAAAVAVLVATPIGKIFKSFFH